MEGRVVAAKSKEENVHNVSSIVYHEFVKSM